MTNKKEQNTTKKLWMKLSQEQQQEIQGGVFKGNGGQNGAMCWPYNPPGGGYGG